MMQRKFFASIFLGISLLVFSGYMNARISFFWNVQTEKGNSYLLGSVYFLNKEHYPLRQVIEDSFAQCDTLMMAVIPSLENQKKIKKLFAEIGMYKGGETLKNNISEKTYQLTAEKMRELGLDIELFKNFKPWMSAMIFLQKCMEKMGFDKSYSYNFYFFGKAKAAKKEIVELEGIESQLKLLDSFSKDEMENFLIYSILEADKVQKNKEDMMRVWIGGDTDGLEKLLNEKRMQYTEVFKMSDEINAVQNKKIVKKIDGYLKEGKKLFLVLPVDRMVHKNGIIQLLKNKGYNVSQL